MKDERGLCGAFFCGTLLLYLAAPSAYYNFDGVACAIAVELGDLRHLAHGNHLAYGLIGLVFARLWRLLGYTGPSILALNALSSLLGAASVAAFLSMLLNLKISRRTAALCAAGLAVSQAFWFWHLETQVYPLGVFFLALAAREGLSERPRPVALGLLQAGAVLGHVGHLMFAPAAIYLLKDSRRWKSRALTYAATLGLAVAAAYALALVFCLKPRSLEDTRLWLLGSAALRVDRSFYWYGGYSPADALDWLKMTARVFVEPAGAGAPHALGVALGFLCAAGAAAGAVIARRRRAAKACVLWIAGYALLFASWQPYVAVYRIGDLLALWLLIALLIDAARVRSLVAEAVLAAWLVATGVYNLKTEILPRSDPGNNSAYQEALFVADATPPDAWIVVTGLGQVYVPYFAHRRPLNLRYFEAALGDLPRRLDDIARQGSAVYVTSTTLEGPWRGTLEAYGLAQAGRSPDGVTLYAVKRTESRAARAGKG